MKLHRTVSIGFLTRKLAWIYYRLWRCRHYDLWPDRCGCEIIVRKISKDRYPLGECHKTALVISQYCSGNGLVPSSNKPSPEPVSDQDLQWHMASLGHNWGRDKMDAISQTTFWSTFSWMKMFEFRWKFHWSLFLRVQLTIFQHWFR